MSFFKKKPETTTVCPNCGHKLDSDLLTLAYNEPTYWESRDKNDADNHLSSDFCTLKIDNEEHYFIRATLSIPIIDSNQTLDWGVWVSQKKENFKKYREVFGQSKKPAGEPYFGWLSNTLPIYPATSGIKSSVSFQEDGLRPVLQLDHGDDHPLCQDQHNGITPGRAHEFVDFVLKREKK